MMHCEEPAGTVRQRGPDSIDLSMLDDDLDALDRDEVVAALRAARLVRSRLDAFELRAHRRLRTLASAGRSEPAEAAIAAASDGDGRHGRSVSERDELCLDAPEVEAALDNGELSGAHLDAFNAACRDLPPEVRTEFLEHAAGLTERAAKLSIDAFRRECRRLAKHLLSVSSGGSDVDEFERQRAASKVTRWTDRATGMCSTLIEVDPLRDAEMSSAVRAEIARLRQTDGNRDLTWKQLELQAWVNCVSGARTDTACSTSTSTSTPTSTSASTPTSRETGRSSGRRIVDRTPQVIAVVDVEMLRVGAHRNELELRCETSEAVDLAAATLRRLCCEAEIIPVVMNGPSQVLDEGRGERTATVEQRHALRAMHTSCAFPRCTVGFESCRMHHVDWWTRDVGPTDLANLLPLCELDHHRVHEGKWSVTLDANRHATWRRPDGVVHHVGPTANRHDE